MLMYNFKEIAAPFDGINSSYDIFNSIKVSIDLEKRINMMRFDKQCVNFSKKKFGMSNFVGFWSTFNMCLKVECFYSVRFRSL